MVIEHDFHIFTVGIVQKTLHVREQPGIDIIAYAPFGSRPPVRIQNQIIQRNIPADKFIDHGFGTVLTIFIKSGIPGSQHSQPHHFVSPGKLYIQPAELLRVLPAQQQINILNILFNPISVIWHITAPGVAALRHQNTRGIVQSKDLRRITKRRQFSAVSAPLPFI